MNKALIVLLISGYGVTSWWFLRKKSPKTHTKPLKQPSNTPQPVSNGQSWTGFVETTTDMNKNDAPRGIRNNNPLNIEFSTRNNWQGQVGSDGRFCIFQDDKYGFRAATRVLRSYQKRGINTIQSIVHTFAPSHENDSDHYANMVAKWSGYDKNKMLDVRNDDVAAKVIKAMARMEVGHKYTIGEVMEGVKLA